MISEDRKVIDLVARLRDWEDTDEEDQGENYQAEFSRIASKVRAIDPEFLSSDEDRDRLERLIHLVGVYEN